MDHKEYIEQFLSADVDNELSVEERQLVWNHLKVCSACRERLSAERAVKAALHGQAGIFAAPPALRDKIRHQLVAAERQGVPRGSWLRARLQPLASAALAAFTVIAVASALLLVNIKLAPADNPLFDAAIAAYLSSQQRFASNVKPVSLDNLAQASAGAFGEPYGWDFSVLGMNLVGSRMDHLLDGRDVIYGLYKGGRGALLAMMNLEPGFKYPSGGEDVSGVHIYKYKGYSVAVASYDGRADTDISCVMVTRLPASTMAHAIRQILE